MNTIGSAHQTGVLGIRRGMEQIERSSASIASAERLNGTRDDLTDSLVGMKEGKLQAQASTKAVQATDEVLGSLLDVKA